MPPRNPLFFSDPLAFFEADPRDVAFTRARVGISLGQLDAQDLVARHGE